MSLSLFDTSIFSWPELQRLEREMGAVDVDKTGDFKYTCNFQGFRPSDIRVHHEGDQIVLEAESKQSGRHEHYERSVRRMIKLPEEVDKESVRCEWNEKGEIVVRASKLPALDQPAKRSIPISFKKSDSSKM